jgi:hypothetical protein
MLFTIGVETPKHGNEAYGLVVPALNNDYYACFSAADHADDTLRMTTDAITTVLQNRVEHGLDIDGIKDLSYRTYQQQPDYAHCDTWLLADIDISEYISKRQCVNISIPDDLLRRIDQRVASNSRYKDRSHFLILAAQRELEEA